MNELRSLARYLSVNVLGSDWEVRFAGQRGDEGAFDRPYAAVIPATPTASTTHGPLHAEVVQTFSVVAYPVAGMNPESSLIEAHRVADVLLSAFNRGADPYLFSRRSPRAHPRRVPRWDYSTTGLYETVGDADRIAPMRVVEPPGFQAFVDAEGRWLVAGDVRLAWTENLAVEDTAPLVAAVTVAPTP